MVLDTVRELLDLPNLRVIAVDLTPDHFTITATSEVMSAACPLCHTLSNHVHSRYERTVLDLNWGTRIVTLVLVHCGQAAPFAPSRGPSAIGLEPTRRH